jgi:hypothetical protein
MATGATGQLGLALPVQGELSGTWGDTVNNGITQYTNIAIAGTLTLTGDGAVTLANTTGDASASNITSTLTGAGTVTAQFAIVKVTGTLTTAKIITAPSYSKTYVVVNSATGSTVSFIRSGQTPAVSIAVGETAFVYYNGTDYVKLTGTATAGAAGGSTTQVQFNSSGVLAGSANMTFNGTTLTVNDLTDSSLTAGRVTYAGTAGNLVDSANLTFNGTTLTANTLSLTNALATTSGGTGLTSFTSGGVVYASSTSALATGSALTFDGTNLSTSGNYISSASLGKFAKADNTGRSMFTGGTTGGTTNGAYIITEGYDYGGTAAGGAINLITAGASSPISFFINGSEGMRLTSTGLGIGTSSPAAKLQVNGVTDTLKTYGSSYNQQIHDSATGTFSQTIYQVNAVTQGLIGVGGGNMLINTGANSTANIIFATGSGTTERLRIASNGAFGLSGANYGTSGQVLTSGGSGAAPTWTTVSGGSSQWVTTGSNIYYNTGGAIIGSTTAYGNGKLTLVPTTNPTTSTDANNQLYIGESSQNSGYYMNLGYIFANGAYNGSIQAIAGGSATNLLLNAASGGNVGIGTLAPAEKLHINNGASTCQIRITGYSRNLYLGQDSTGALVYSDGAVPMLFYTNATEKMRITSAGDVGIGTATPDGKLQVYSNTSATLIRVTSSTSGTAGIDFGDTSAVDQGRLRYDNSTDALIIGTAGSERMRISSTGQVLINCTATTPAGVGGANIKFNTACQVTMASGTATTGDESKGYINFLPRGSSTNGSNSEAWANLATGVFIDSQIESGNDALCNSALLIRGQTGFASSPGALIRAGTGANGGASFTQQFRVLYNGNVANTNGTYGTLSDARAKQDITDASSQWDDIKAVRVRKYRLISDIERSVGTGIEAPYQIGVVAQELQQTSPGLVETNGDESNMMTVKSSIMYMKAIKALQEAMTRIEQLEARLDAANL